MKQKIKRNSVKKIGLWSSLTILLSLFALAGYYYFQEKPEKLEAGLPDNALVALNQTIPANSIAVLPFVAVSSEEANQDFTDGIHYSLLTHLSKIGAMRVIARTSVQGFKDTKQSIKEIANLLEVANILKGSVQRIGNNLAIQVQLYKANTAEIIWSASYNKLVTTKDLFELQTTIVRNIAEVLQTTITPAQQKALTENSTNNLAAYEAYLKARQLMEIRNANTLNQAKSLFEKAIDLDEQFALAYIHLGSVYSLLAAYAGLDRKIAHQLAWENMEKGMALNDHLADAYALKGILINNNDRDLEAASIAYEKAIAINPNYAASYHWYANTVRDLGRDFERASTIFQKAVQLNPLSPVVLLNHSIYYAESGNGPAAIRITKKGSRVEPGYPFFWMDLSLNFTYEGHLDSAAYYTYQGIQQNAPHGLFLRYYIEDLENLGMTKEIEDIITNFNPKTRQDSLIGLTAELNLAYTEKDFNKAESLLIQIEKIRAKKNFPAWHQYDYYSNAFQKVIARYEQEHPNFLTGTHLSAYSMGALSRFQEYLFCLRQVGELQKAKALWEKFSFLIVKKPEGKDEFKMNRKRRAIFRIRHASMEGQIDQALQLLTEYYQEDILDYVEEFDLDPAYASIRTHPTYQQIMGKVTAKVAEQRKSFRRYLNEDVVYSLIGQLD